MVNKDQLDQTPEGQQVLALLAKNFAAEQFQPALTLIEQRFTEDETVWDAELNSESKFPFLKTNSAHRLLVFFASPTHLARIKTELEQRAAEHPITPPQTLAAAKPKAKRKPHPKPVAAAKKARRPKKKTVKTAKRKPQRSKPSKKRPTKRKSLPAKARKSRARKR